jgi:ABC-type nitrate/sulfonate/bicarbonate transport system substrate-binding protein
MKKATADFKAHFKKHPKTHQRTSRLKQLASCAVALALAASFLSGCGGGGNVGLADDGLFHLRVLTQTGFNEATVADVMGFFKEEGIKLDYIGTAGKGVTAFQLLEQGEVDAFISSHPAELAQARLAGIDVVAVAPGMVDHPEYPHVRYLVRNDSEVQTLTDLAGKKVASGSISTCSTGYLKYYLKSQGLDPESIEFVVISATGQLEQPVFQGLVDASTSHPPYAGKALATGEVRQIASSWDILHDPGAGLSIRGFSGKFIEEHPDVVQGFVNAMYRSRLWINENLEEAKRVTAAYLEIPEGDLSNFYYDPNKNITPSYIDKWFEIAEDIGLWEHGDITPDVTFTTRFVPTDPPASDATLKWDGTIER